MASTGGLVRALRRALGGERNVRRGGTDVRAARRLADAERAAGGVPGGSAWLDEQTVGDLDLPLVFRAIDRTSSPLGGQALWRWLAAPAMSHDVLATREQQIALLADPERREAVARDVPEIADVDAHVLPQLLWEDAAPPARSPTAIVLVTALVACLVLARWSPGMFVGAAMLLVVTIVFDMFAQRHLAEQAHALVVLGSTLDGAARLAFHPQLPPELLGTIRADLAVRAALRKRLMLLTVRDPFDLLELLRAIFLVRLFAIRSCMRIVLAHRDPLQRLVLWVCTLDALASIGRLREERPATRIASIVDGPAAVEVTDLVHPVLANAIGNDLHLRSGLLITGSNMSGKSTFLRTVGVNAVLAQSIHTTFGGWRGPLVCVRAAMRINDDLARGMSTYAAEVESVGTLVKAVLEPGPATPLTLLDEPFHGTNPAVRVPIVVAVLEHLAAHGMVMAATHDLDVATLVGPMFDRGYFSELASGDFDRTLRSGIAPSTNAVELLARAGYPPELLARIAAVSAAT
jgi:hypothetical protein